MLTLDVHATALKALASLPERDQGRIKAAINLLLDEPYPRGSIKVKGYEPAIFRIRVGHYRVLYHVDHDIHRLRVAIIDKRARVYE